MDPSFSMLPPYSPKKMSRNKNISGNFIGEGQKEILEEMGQ